MYCPWVSEKISLRIQSAEWQGAVTHCLWNVHNIPQLRIHTISLLNRHWICTSLFRLQVYLVSLSFTRIYSAFDFTLKIRLNRENIKIHPSFCNCKFWGYQKLHFCHQIKILWHLAWTSWDQSSKTKDKKSRRKVGRFWLCLPSLREIWVQTSWTQKDLNWFSSSGEDVLCLQMKTTQGHQTWYSGSLLSDLSRRSSPLC